MSSRTRGLVKPAPLPERFESGVDRSGGPDACHPWTGKLDTSGYGVLDVEKKMQRAHRVSFFLAHGRWPKPCCLHRCDTPACVNESHLFEGTQLENIADRHAKGRTVMSEQFRRNHAKRTG